MATIDQIIQSAGLKEVTPEEPITDETAQTTETPAAEAASEEGAAPVTTPEPAPVVDRYKILSDTLGTEFKSDEDIENYKSSLTGYQAKLTEYESKETQWAAEREELAKGVDPMSFFASPELFVLNGLLKKFPDKNPLALTEISTKDFSKSYLETPVDVLALDLMLEHPGVYGNKAEAIEDINAKYGIEDPDDISAQAKRRMQVDAKTAVDKFAGIKAQITPPAPVDLSAARAEKDKTNNERINKMTEATKPLFTKMIPEALKEVEFPITVKGEDGKDVTEIAFKYEIGESYVKSKVVKEVLESVRNSTIQNGTEWTAEKESQTKQEVVDLLKANYLYHNREKIYAALSDDLQTKFKDEAWMKRHNVRPLRQDGTAAKVDPAKVKFEQQQAAELKRMGIKV